MRLPGTMPFFYLASTGTLTQPFHLAAAARIFVLNSDHLFTLPPLSPARVTNVDLKQSARCGHTAGVL
jgi:hypothetical protein